jgi:glutathione S-transferase
VWIVPVVLYHLSECPYCEKVRLALGLERIAYESLTIEPEDRNEVQKISGQSLVPVLVDNDGTVIIESNRILRHLAAMPKSRLLPSSRRDQTLTWVLVDRSDVILSPICKRLTRRVDDDESPLSDDDLRVLRRRLEEELAVIEGILERGPYLFGDHPTVADIATHAFLNRLPNEEIVPMIGDYPRLTGWYDRMLDESRLGVSR